MARLLAGVVVLALWSLGALAILLLVMVLLFRLGLWDTVGSGSGDCVGKLAVGVSDGVGSGVGCGGIGSGLGEGSGVGCGVGVASGVGVGVADSVSGDVVGLVKSAEEY